MILLIRRKREKKREKYPRYLGLSIVKADLHVGMKFRYKKQLKEDVNNYKIVKGYNLKITKSDTVRFQCLCLGNGCNWSMWASKCKNESSFQLSKMENPHSCIPFSFEQGSRYMLTSWLVDYCTETFRLQPTLRVSELKGLVDKDHNYKATLSMCSRIRAKALHAIIGEYKGQFGQIRDYLYELCKKNPSTTIKVKTFKDGDDRVFKFLYICLRILKMDFLDGCKRVISLDACFLKSHWNGQVFVAVGRDANNQMYALAWGVGMWHRAKKKRGL